MSKLGGNNPPPATGGVGHPALMSKVGQDPRGPDIYAEWCVIYCRVSHSTSFHLKPDLLFYADIRG